MKTEYLEILETVLEKKENKSIEDVILRDIRNIFEDEEEENHYKPVIVSNFWSNSYIEHKISVDRNKILSVEEYFNKIRSYLKDIVNNKNPDT